MPPTIAVIGAGAAGLMAAVHAAGPGRRVRLFERTAEGGRKILIAGGGRCNVLPSEDAERRFITASSPSTLRNLLRSWPLTEQRAFFERELGIPLALEAETGKLFPVSNRARDIRDGLRREAVRRGVEWHANRTVRDLTPTGGAWRLDFADRDPVTVDRVILTTGGLSVPQTGSDGTGLEWLRKLGHTVHPTYPALAPLTAEPPGFSDLAGVSLPVTIRGHWCRDRRETRGGFLFTHRGFSGPAVLNLSDLAIRARLEGGESATLEVQWTAADDEAWTSILTSGRGTVAGLLRPHLPARLAHRLMEDVGVPGEQDVAQLSRGHRQRLIEALTRFRLPVAGDEGYRKAEVTGGGLALGEVDPRTMESRRHPGLYAAGEVLDAFGPIGGYNFQWAWTTGRLAGRGAARPPASPS